MKVIYDAKASPYDAINLFGCHLERSAFAKMSPETLFYFTIMKGRKLKLLERDSLPEQ